MCEALREHPHLISGSRVLELGCGCGLAGLFCMGLRAQSVLFTDWDAAALRQSKANLHVNKDGVSGALAESKSHVQFGLLSWGEAGVGEEDVVVAAATCDLVLACDVCYDAHQPRLVADT